MIIIYDNIHMTIDIVDVAIDIMISIVAYLHASCLLALAYCLSQFWMRNDLIRFLRPGLERWFLLIQGRIYKQVKLK